MTIESTPTATTTTTEGSATPEAGTTATAADTTGQTQQATEGQTSTETTKVEADAGKTDGEQAKPTGAPDKYEFTAAEGQKFNDAVIGQFSEVAKELNLPQADAQKFLDKVAPVIQAQQAEVLQAARVEWNETTKADKEIGGDKLPENLAVAKKAMETFGTPELRTLLNESGLGDHPEIIRAFFRAGKAISEDKFVGNGQGVTETKTAAQRMYPNMNP